MARKKKEEKIKIIKENILDVDFSEAIESSYLDYSLDVLMQRALPDIRDGLKPVQRRVLYAMKELNLNYNSQYKKCAKIVGNTMSSYHPHGDLSIYGALVNMAQNFRLNTPLIDGHGK